MRRIDAPRLLPLRFGPERGMQPSCEVEGCDRPGLGVPFDDRLHWFCFGHAGKAQSPTLALTRLAVLLQRARRASSAQSVGIGLLTALLIAEGNPEYAGRLRAEAIGSISADELAATRQDIRELIGRVPVGGHG